MVQMFSKERTRSAYPYAALHAHNIDHFPMKFAQFIFILLAHTAIIALYVIIIIKIFLIIFLKIIIIIVAVLLEVFWTGFAIIIVIMERVGQIEKGVVVC